MFDEMFRGPRWFDHVYATLKKVVEALRYSQTYRKCDSQLECDEYMPLPLPTPLIGLEGTHSGFRNG